MYGEEDLTLKLLDLKNGTLSKLDRCRKYLVDNQQTKKFEETRKTFDSKTFPTHLHDILKSNLLLSQQRLKKDLNKRFQKMLTAIKSQAISKTSTPNTFAHSLQVLEHEFNTGFIQGLQDNP